MAEWKPDRALWIGLLILFLAILAFLMAATGRPGFFRGFPAVF